METLYDYLLLTIAVERMSSFGTTTLISEEEMDQRLGITEEDLESVREAEFE